MPEHRVARDSAVREPLSMPQFMSDQHPSPLGDCIQDAPIQVNVIVPAAFVACRHLSPRWRQRLVNLVADDVELSVEGPCRAPASLFAPGVPGILDLGHLPGGECRVETDALGRPAAGDEEQCEWREFHIHIVIRESELVK